MFGKTLNNKSGWLFVLPWDIDYPGGVNQVVKNMINVFRKNSLVSPELLIDHYPLLHSTRDIGIPVKHVCLSNPSWAPGYLGLFKYILKLPLAFFTLHNLISEEIVCINPHNPTLNVLNFVLYRICGFYKGKLILSFHGSDVLSIKYSAGLTKYLWFFIFRNVDNLVCCSNGLATELSAFIESPIVKKKVSVIHNGIDVILLDAELIQSKMLPKQLVNVRYILNIATFESNKRQTILIQAFARIKATYPDLKLVLIGRNAPMLQNYRALAEKLDCQQDIIFVEDLPHADVLPFLQNAEIFCLPSNFESFGIVILEAGFFFRPVIATCVGGIPEIILNGQDGVLIEPDNIEELAIVLCDLLNNPKTARGYGARLRDKVVNEFTWDIAEKKYLNL